MKCILVLGLIVSFSMIAFSQPSFAGKCDTLKRGQAAFFQHSNYKGSCVVRNTGRYSNSKGIGIGNDKISSIKVGPRTQVKMCRDNNFKGGCKTYTRSMASLGKMNDKTSSAIVGNCNPKANQVAFYQHANYQGACSIRNVGLYANSKSIGIGNDKISSVKIGSGTHVELCRDSNFKGCTSYSKSMPSLGKMNDKTSSARIVRTVPPKTENVALISTADCIAYGGSVGKASNCASGRRCLLNNVNACTSNVKATTKD